MRLWDSGFATTHLMSADGKDTWVVTHGKSKIKHARISTTGKVHIVKHVIIRWNFMGGTRDRPDVSFVLACGPQTRHPIPAPGFGLHELCARCGNYSSAGP